MDLTIAEKSPEIGKLYDKLNVACCSFNEKGVLTACNLAWARLFKLESKSEAKKKFNKLFPKDCRMFLKEGIQTAFNDGHAEFDVKCLAADGTEIYLTVSLSKETDNLVTGHVFDITKYKKALPGEFEAELIQAERQRQIYDAYPISVHYMDEDCELIDCNKAALKLYEVTGFEDINARLSEFFPWNQPCGTNSILKVKQLVKETFEKGIVQSSITHLNTFGEFIPAEATYVRIDGETHNGKRVLAVITQDLRSLHLEMEKVREEQLATTILLDNSPYGVAIWNRNFIPESANKQLFNIYGVKDLQEYGELLLKLHGENRHEGMLSRDEFNLYLMRAFDGETIRYDGLSMTGLGELLPCEVTLVPFRRNKQLYVAGYISDLRKVKAAMDKLREAEDNSNILINALPIANALVGPKPDYRIIECNQAAVNLLAMKQGEPFEYFESEDSEAYYCNGKCTECINFQSSTCIARRCLLINWRKTIKGYDEDRDKVFEWTRVQCETAEEQGRNVFTSYRNTLFGGEVFVETTIVPVWIKGEQGFALHLRDLSEARLREEAEEENREKTRFLARMSHEIRTPMNAILGVTEIELQKDNPTTTEDAFLRIRQSSHMLLSIINDILDISKVEAGKMEIVPQPYELPEKIVECVQLNMMHIGDKKIDFKLSVDENLPRSANGDALRINQILNNLLSNAFKYSDSGTVTLSIKREKHEDDKMFMLAFEIKDTGQGMSKSQLNTLFEIEYNRHNLSLNRDIQGSGLGMTITYHLVNLMNGKITVDSVIGKGTTFFVKIPQEIKGTELLGETARELENIKAVKNILKRTKKIEHEIMSSGRVLVVDDVESNLFVVKGMLMPYKINVETVSSGQEAVDKVKDGNAYDIIFMDHMMPEMDGVEATRIIHEEGYDSPIVALTANTLIGQEEFFLTNGFAGFIAKPIDAVKLDTCLKEFIKTKQQPVPTEPPAAQAAPDGLVELVLRDIIKAKHTITDIMQSGYFGDENIKLYTVNTHGIKSALANIGENGLSDAAHALEQAGNEGNLELIESDTADFLKNLTAFIERLDPTENPDFMRNNLQTIFESCESYNKKAARKALAALNRKSWPDDIQELLDNISEDVLHSEFEAAAVKAREYLSAL